MSAERRFSRTAEKTASRHRSNQSRTRAVVDQALDRLATAPMGGPAAPAAARLELLWSAFSALAVVSGGMSALACQLAGLASWSWVRRESVPVLVATTRMTWCTSAVTATTTRRSLSRAGSSSALARRQSGRSSARSWWPWPLRLRTGSPEAGTTGRRCTATCAGGSRSVPTDPTRRRERTAPLPALLPARLRRHRSGQTAAGRRHRARQAAPHYDLRP
jgi:hypothetical protein